MEGAGVFAWSSTNIRVRHLFAWHVHHRGNHGAVSVGEYDTRLGGSTQCDRKAVSSVTS
ncbi:hypothetical protein JG687_00018091 [Phytophthora cactorum]|uniref:Uncharacterized protein n=1 Tax=Phytophthora cactorum TaxID=29920 RepID=A0A8T1TNF0_9STRA|nr:hypothetical protein JG687_00018091 [Phytophthora cactorum]